MIVVYETFFLERLRDFKFSVPPQGGIWLIMTILTQYLSSNLVPPPHRNSSQVPPQDRKKPCIFNLDSICLPVEPPLVVLYHIVLPRFHLFFLWFHSLPSFASSTLIFSLPLIHVFYPSSCFVPFLCQGLFSGFTLIVFLPFVWSSKCLPLSRT